MKTMPFLPSDAGLWAIETSALARLMAAVREVSAEIRKPEGAIDDFRGLPMEVSGSIAQISLRGPMERRPSFVGSILGMASTDLVRDAVKVAANDDSVKSILLAVDSPGGSVDGLSELGDTVRQARDRKQVVAQVQGTAASAAYYVAAQADKIFAERTDLIGSIGTKATFVDSSEFMSESGVKVVTVDSGGLKSAGEDGTPITDEQREYFQGLVDFYYKDFLDAVAQGRRISLVEAKALGTGEVWPAPQALDLGLIDGIQSADLTAQKLGMGRIRRSIQTAKAQLDLLTS